MVAGGGGDVDRLVLEPVDGLSRGALWLFLNVRNSAPKLCDGLWDRNKSILSPRLRCGCCGGVDGNQLKKIVVVIWYKCWWNKCDMSYFLQSDK